jgi:hypothetical protein
MSPAELRCRREALGLSQWALGEALAIPQVDISRMELGSQPMPPSLGCGVESLENQMASMRLAMRQIADAAIDLGDTPTLIAHLSDQGFWRAHPDADGLPAAVQRVAAAHARRDIHEWSGVRPEIVAAS